MFKHIRRSFCCGLLLVLLGSPLVLTAKDAPDAASATRLFKQLLSNLNHMQAKFAQTVFDADGVVRHRAQGNMALSRPNKFLWQTALPMKQLVVADGLNLWIYDIDLEQVTVRPLDGALGESPALLLSGDAQTLAQRFELTQLKQQTGQAYQLKPRDTQSSYKQVILYFDAHHLQSMDLYDKLSQHTKIVFSEINTAQTISQALFRFKPPAQVDIIGHPVPAKSRK